MKNLKKSAEATLIVKLELMNRIHPSSADDVSAVLSFCDVADTT